MSRSSCHASSSAGPSPSEYPESAAPSTYRIERFDSAPSSDLMVTSRAKRSTAGNRLKALLDQELEKDEIFAEVENDAEFEADETNAVDIVDSDFDRESDDDALAVEDESEGEREIEAQEKAEKSRRRAAARVVGIVKRPTASIATPTLPKTLRRPAPSATGEEDAGTPQAKRRRISFAPDQPDASSRSSPIARPSGDSARRSSARSATVQSKREVESRLEEASQRRASQPIKAASKKKQSLTQDALIAEALEVEEENRESLRRFLEQEEERRAKQRMRKERITGPFVRWISVGMRTRVADEVKQADTATEETVWTGSFGEETSQPGRASLTTVEANATANKSEAQTANTEQTSRSGPVLDQKSGSHSVVAQQQVEQTQSGSTIDPHQEVMDVSTPPPPQLHLKSQAEESTTASSTGDAEVARSDLSAQAEIFTTSSADPVATPYKMTEPHTANLPKQSDEISAPASLSAATAFTANRTSAISAQAPVSAASLTLDPAISARQEATAIRTASKPSIATSSSSGPSSATSSFKFEKQARTLLCVENAPEDWEWLDEYNAIFGDHCQWDAYPYVPSRNRPVKPRQSICPITGLPALYRDPRTGIPYANSYGYKVITKVLENRFVWTGGHYQQPPAIDGGEDANGKKRKKEKGKERGKVMGGKVGVGAVPVEMGIYIDEETEAGAGKVWSTARELAPITTATDMNHSKISTFSKPALENPTNMTTINNNNNRKKASLSENDSTTTTQTKKKMKSHFEVILTNSIAPGDEKALMAAALSLPAGSTRSGRRVQRSS